MTDTTVPTGWTPDASPKPATLPQLRALIEKLQRMSVSASRNNAIDALDNAIDCLVYYSGWLEFVEETEDGADDCADLMATQEDALGRGW